MGLDTSHNCWSGPYSSFNTFRRSLAKIKGFDLYECQGFGGSNELDKSLDLHSLLNHSDCDGIIQVTEAKKIIKGLDNVILNIHKTGIPYIGFIDHLIRFRDGCKLAVSLNEKIEFH